MRTEEITAPGFIHDVMATTFVLFITSPAFAALGRRPGPARAGVLPRRRRPACCSRTAAMPCSAWTAPPTSPPSTRSPPATATGTPTMSAASAQCRPAVRPARRRAVVLSDAEARWPAKPGGAARAALPPSSATRWCRRAAGWRAPTSPTPSARCGRPGCCMPGLVRKIAFSGQIAKVIAFALEAAGAPIVKGGAKNLLAAFEALIRERGGDIRTGADVASIVLDAGGRARGVRLASAKRSRPTRASSARSRRRSSTAGCSASGARPMSTQASRKYRYGKGNFQIHYALDKPPAWRGDGARQGRAAAPDAGPRRRLEGLQRGGARHAAGSADHLRRPAACARPVALPGGQGDPVAATARGAAPHQGRRRRQARGAG